MNSAKLIIFVTSRATDPYVNTLIHCFENLGVTSVEFVVISDHNYPQDGGKEGIEEKLATRVQITVLAQLEALANGFYIAHNGVQESLQSVEASQLERYARALEKVNRGGCSARSVPLGKLAEYLSELKNRHKPVDMVLDVTALKKHLLVDVTTTCLSLELLRVYAFDIIKIYSEPGKKVLIHALLHEQDYLYRNLTESPPVAKAVKVFRRWTVSGRIFVPVVSLLITGSILLMLQNGVQAALGFVGFVGSLMSILSFILQG
ncbi:MAG: hypothetical protein H6739_25665, partial [Alphaproteobacteria bacterium]|nr:hypothetical protein [Alphaproteobacteria bacterium]